MSGSRAPNDRFRRARLRSGLTQQQTADAVSERLGREVDAEYIGRLERGLVRWPNRDTRTALRALFDAKADMDLGFYSTRLPRPATPDGKSEWLVTSVKFVPIYLGVEVARQVAADRRFRDETYEGLDARSVEIPSEYDDCVVTVFSFGVAVVKIREDCRFASIAELAVWRRTTYIAVRESISEMLRSEWPAIRTAPSYVLSCYWLTDPQSVRGENLRTAMRLACCPSVLLERRQDQTCEEMLSGAELAEQQCFREGFTHPDMEPFGVDGVAIGYASWSGVSYLPLSTSRAVTLGELVTFETVIQALWCYTNMIAEVVEGGNDPTVPEAYGWRFIRACQSRLTTARPWENSQNRTMRDAILRTSRLNSQMTAAQATLRDLAHSTGRR